MDVWPQRGQVILLTALTLILMMFLLERVIFHTVVGWDSLPRSIILLIVILLMEWLIYQGIPIVRWLLGGFLILNSLGVPQGIEQVFGATGASLIILLLLLIQVSTALVLCLAPGIPSFMRYQRQQRRERKQKLPSA